MDTYAPCMDLNVNVLICYVIDTVMLTQPYIYLVFVFILVLSYIL